MTSPFVIFNTYNFEMLEFDQETAEFIRLRVKDDERVEDQIPKYFKSQVVSDDEVVILGGCDEIYTEEGVKTEASNKAFKITKGALKQLPRMQRPRQYFSLCYDQPRKEVYVIGGYNEDQGVLAS
jgi:hypothetical protein